MKIPVNCEASYFANFLSIEEADNLYQYLVAHYDIQPLEIVLPNGAIHKANYGKLMFLEESLHQSNALHEEAWGKTTPFPSRLNEIKAKVEKVAEKQYMIGVCIFYPDGQSGVDYHSDYRAFGDTTVIASLSLGAERIFHLREKATQEIYTQRLAHGSLFIMGKHCQDRYEHALPVDSTVTKPRINITFRQYGDLS